MTHLLIAIVLASVVVCGAEHNGGSGDDDDEHRCVTTTETGECMELLDRTDWVWPSDPHGITTDWDQDTNTLQVLNDVEHRWTDDKRSSIPLMMKNAIDFTDIIGAEFTVTAKFTGNASCTTRMTAGDLNTILKANPQFTGDDTAMSANSIGNEGCATGVNSSSLADLVAEKQAADKEVVYSINPGNRLYAVVLDEYGTVHWAAGLLDIPIANGPSRADVASDTHPQNTHREYPEDTSYTFRFMFDNVVDQLFDSYNNNAFDYRLTYEGNGPCPSLGTYDGTTSGTKIPRRYFNETSYPIEFGDFLGTPTWDYNQAMNRTGKMRFGIVPYFTKKSTCKYMNMGDDIVGGITYTFKTNLLREPTTITTTTTTTTTTTVDINVGDTVLLSADENAVRAAIATLGSTWNDGILAMLNQSHYVYAAGPTLEGTPENAFTVDTVSLGVITSEGTAYLQPFPLSVVTKVPSQVVVTTTATGTSTTTVATCTGSDYAAYSSTCEYINLSNTGMDDADAIALADALKHMTALKYLGLSHNDIGDNGLAALADALKNNTVLLSLHLTNNNIGDNGLVALADALKNNAALRNVYLGNNTIGDTGASALAGALEPFTALRNLYLYHNNIGDDGASALAGALENSTGPRYLYLYHNNIGDDGASALADALKNNTAIRTLSLDANCIGDDGAFALSSILESTVLTLLNLQNNRIGSAGLAALQVWGNITGAALFTDGQCDGSSTTNVIGGCAVCNTTTTVSSTPTQSCLSHDCFALSGTNPLFKNYDRPCNGNESACSDDYCCHVIENCDDYLCAGPDMISLDNNAVCLVNSSDPTATTCSDDLCCTATTTSVAAGPSTADNTPSTSTSSSSFNTTTVGTVCTPDYFTFDVELIDPSFGNTQEQCEIECFYNLECASYVFRSNTKSCKIYPASANFHPTFGLAHFQHCVVPKTVCIPNTRRSGNADVKLSNNLTGDTNFTLHECAAECNSKSECAHFLFKTDNGWCELWSTTSGSFLTEGPDSSGWWYCDSAGELPIATTLTTTTHTATTATSTTATSTTQTTLTTTTHTTTTATSTTQTTLTTTTHTATTATSTTATSTTQTTHTSATQTTHTATTHTATTFTATTFTRTTTSITSATSTTETTTTKQFFLITPTTTPLFLPVDLRFDLLVGMKMTMALPHDWFIRGPISTWEPLYHSDMAFDVINYMATQLKRTAPTYLQTGSFGMSMIRIDHSTAIGWWGNDLSVTDAMQLIDQFPEDPRVVYSPRVEFHDPETGELRLFFPNYEKGEANLINEAIAAGNATITFNDGTQATVLGATFVDKTADTSSVLGGKILAGLIVLLAVILVSMAALIVIGRKKTESRPGYEQIPSLGWF
jgi:hypothetical protein